MAKRKESDEWYVVNLCDEALRKKAERGHRFPFLLGDPGSRGPAKLPVDAFYPDLNLVIEYRERQHFEAVRHFRQALENDCK